MQVYRCQWNKNHQQSTQHISKELFYKNRVQKGVAFIGATCRYHRHGDCPRLDLFLFLPAGSQESNEAPPSGDDAGHKCPRCYSSNMCIQHISAYTVQLYSATTAKRPFIHKNSAFCELSKAGKNCSTASFSVVACCCQTLHLPFQDHRLVMSCPANDSPTNAPSSKTETHTQPTPRIARQGQTENLGFWSRRKKDSQIGATSSWGW